MKMLDYMIYYIAIISALLRMTMVVCGIELVMVEQLIWIGLSFTLLICVKKDWEDKSKLM